MAIIDILQYPDPRLKRKGVTVTDFGADFQRVIDDMLETHYNAENCAALAATQLALDPAPHVTVIDFSEHHNKPLCIVNGKITSSEGEQNEEEGCMSVGCDQGISLYGRVKRALKIEVQGQDRYGNPLVIQASDYMAKCIQHELDHLSGILFIDHLSSLKRDIFEKKLIKARRLREND